ncbi:MAG: GNAT family N-acetyltransferase [Nitrospirales bacterium]|nr:GNAT family N-acetyltransferase [Nitrospirales bacterium]
MISGIPFNTERAASSLIIKQASSKDEILKAKRLRFEVFNLELKEGLPSSYLTGLDTDEYDSYCDHIIILDTFQDRVVGTYRMLSGTKTEAGVGYYSEQEFEMSRIKMLPGKKIELGRACVHRDYRNTAVLGLLWSGIAWYVEEHKIDYLFGCGSIHTINPNIVSSIYAHLRKTHLADESCRTYPIRKVPGFRETDEYDREAITPYIPALLRSYLRIGAKITGEPAWDEEFGVSDFLILLSRNQIIGRYKRHYFS